jgi:hypothetical protein
MTVQNAELLAYSWRRAGQPDPLTFLCAGGEVEIEGFEVIPTADATHTDGNYYPPYNKPSSIFQYLHQRGHEVRSHSILVLDPDMVLLAPLGDLAATPGRVTCDGPWDWIAENFTSDSIRARSRNPDLVAASGVPYLIDATDLEMVCPLWIEHIRSLRRDHQPKLGWVAEMTAWDLAVADMGIETDLLPWSCGPLLHYHGPPPSSRCLSPYPWNKTTYRWSQWDDPPEVLKDHTTPIPEFAEVLREYAAIRRGEVPDLTLIPAPLLRHHVPYLGRVVG